ncbi:MAG: multidrug effflux MFS transporter [Zhongshania sp.]|uniref:multidrug effflux MFS transporter n=1 Tax=Zhongshania sp. TaxID=1971902 RepID=UPI0026123E4E|nr:multidrug effflux MFS transporter [Zhongshania sp.]MDF1692780.1 multidrug effflux MFS transporter [Zhongshania sp.]
MSSTLPPLRLILLLALIFALSPLAIDMYLPTIPAIAAELGVPVQDIAVTVSLYMLGLSFGQFFGGPISDYFGRRPALFFGLTVFAMASVVIAFTESLSVFWAARFFQALGGGFASVVVPAIIRDHTEGQATAKLFSQIMLITIIAPALAPTIGTVLYSLSGWQLVFLVLAAYAITVCGLASIIIKKRGSEQRAPLADSLLTRYKFVVSNRAAMGYLLAQSLGFSVMITFVANAALVYIDMYGQSEAVFSMLFAGNIVTLAIANRINNRLLNTVPAAQILPRAMLNLFVFCSALLLVTGFSPPLWVVVPLVMLAIGALGGIMGNSQACALQFFPQHSGIASALMGSGQYLIGGVISGLSTQFHSEHMWPMTVTMFLASALGLYCVPKPSKQPAALSSEAC